MTTDPFVAPFTLEYTYKRSLGPILSRFFTKLREGQILGARTARGTVLVPPCEYDPETGADVLDLVEVGPEGTVTSWTLVHEVAGPLPEASGPVPEASGPVPGTPIAPPFAWALIRLDGADTALLHALDAPAGSLAVGMRVRPRWAPERTGQLWDILCFEPVPFERVSSEPIG